MSVDENKSGQLQRLAFYATPVHDCSYLRDRSAITLFADPKASMDNHLYSQLSLFGFRRSGRHIYRPACPACSACIPVRIPVNEFEPRRNQRRTWTRNRDLTVVQVPAEYTPEHFELFERYVKTRHPGGGMDNPDPNQFMDFLTSDWSDTRFVEFRDHARLLAVAVIDVLEQGLSAVYTYFDPAESHRSLGTHAILWEIEETRRLGHDWLYLGYWIRECPQMRYKEQFRPLEHFHEGVWSRM